MRRYIDLLESLFESSEPKELGPDGVFTQSKDSGAGREGVEDKHRQFLARHFFYGEPDVGNEHSFDKTGNYRCGDCAFVNEARDNCALVDLKALDPKAGSCKHWEMRDAGDSDLPPTKFLSVADASYGVAKNGEGFGCFRCPFASKAHEPDSKGRTLYCGKADCRVFEKACCALNGAECLPMDKYGVVSKSD